MKKNFIATMSVVLFATLALAACQPSSDGSSTSSDSSDTSSTLDTKTYALQVDASNVKTEFTTKDTFTSQGLIVKLITTTNGVSDEGVITENYSLYIDGEQVSEGSTLTRGEKEVIVASNETDKNVISGFYNINVTQAAEKLTLNDVVTKMLETGSYTVNSTYMLDTTTFAPVFARVTDYGIYWQEPDATFDDYDFTDWYGYSSYQDKTFRYQINNGVVENVAFLDGLSSNSKDYGLWSKDNRDEYGYLTANYSINSITDEEKQYIANLQPTEGNIYNIDVKYSGWLFSMIGHKYVYYNPEYSFGSGIIRVIVGSDYSLEVYVESTNSMGAAYPMTSTINRVGETTIPELEQFLENPDFGDIEINNPVLNLIDLIDAGNYTIETNEQSLIYYTENYIYGESLTQFEDNVPLNVISLSEGNTLGKPAGLYPLIEQSGNFSVKEEKAIIKYELNYFRLFKSLDTYFTKATTYYVYTLDQDSEMTPDSSGTLSYIIPWFIDSNFDAETGIKNISKVMLSFNTMDNEYYFEFFNNENTSIGHFTIFNFGSTAYEPVETYFNSVNKVA